MNYPLAPAVHIAITGILGGTLHCEISVHFCGESEMGAEPEYTIASANECVPIMHRKWTSIANVSLYHSEMLI